MPAHPQESVIHSFTPTNEFSGAYIKINGDFSTDPSRKTIDMDPPSEVAFHDATQIIAQTVISILEGDLSRKGFFTPFVKNPSHASSRFRTILIKEIKEILQAKNITNDVIPYEFTSVRVKPDWLNYEDYMLICISGVNSVSKDIITAYPEINSFLELISVPKLTLGEIKRRINSVNFSVIGYAQVFAKVVGQYRFDMEKIAIDEIKRLKLFPTLRGIVSAESIRSDDEFSVDYISHLKNNLDEADLFIFLRRLNVSLGKLMESQPEQIPKIDSSIETNENTQIKGAADREFSKEGTTELGKVKFRTEPTIKKWRSTEKNVTEYFKALNVVLGVDDVTQANLGYDLEVLLISGKKIFVEVKSLSSFSESFKITNNEYSSAHSYGEDYYIALAINDDTFQVKLIQNPIKKLSFDKKCERWSWYCEKYSNSLQTLDELLS